ncbi:MAG: NADP oxidoreductase [Chloroflexi bacterium]|nr:NADP oxidoreductase [Chloroflexota bacterium]
MPAARPTLATVWLDGCSGCHMSLLDLDHDLLALAEVADLVFSPIVDTKVFPDTVDVTLVEGAVSSVEDEHKIKHIRARTRVLVAFGDCAVTGNVPSMRNYTGGPEAVLRRGYLENVTLQPQIPNRVVPMLRPRVQPIHEVVPVDVYLPGCPPRPAEILAAVQALLGGALPALGGRTWFGR